MLPLPGPRVTLRRLRAGDLAPFQAYRHDADVGRWQGWTALPDADALAFLQMMAVAPAFAPGQWLQLGIAGRHDDSLLGDIGLHTSATGDSVEIGFTLAAQAQGHGLATEALALALQWVWLHSAAQQVLACTDTRNTACVRLLQRLGLVQAQTLDASFRSEACREHHFQVARPATLLASASAA